MWGYDGLRIGWADDRIDYARDWWKGDPQYWGWNGTVDTAADLAAGFSDMFRVGGGLGYAIYVPDENAYGRAAFATMDLARAAGLFGSLASPIAKPAALGAEYCPTKNIRIAPFGNRTGHPTGELPHYHRPRFDSDGNVKPSQGKSRHRPWDRRSGDNTFWDRF